MNLFLIFAKTCFIQIMLQHLLYSASGTYKDLNAAGEWVLFYINDCFAE